MDGGGEVDMETSDTVVDPEIHELLSMTKSDR